ncbi:hypothetical protein AWM75_03875 [Aerococcus urinaehominis]|uniref:Uncharacterized protein n=1 Tax=Aerococcus urinaehominis TaxID=128944 RepID=A0A0X8FKX1_9LACT|nr:GNAT family N-acetyltransferase [Aerococcus urinaehominis]AMB99194.1 hypothetical protein AWM75_03875 [Aerococcus urinaehominis]SDM32758.1 phosphinothricin acetyltransferase [Aerococcus urinaehominis]
MIIRPASPNDAQAICNIYRYYVEHTSISFEETTPTTEEMKNRIVDFTSNYPFLIAEDQGKMLGYAYAHAFGDRPAYRYTAELSIYTKHTDKGRGIGRQLYQALEDQLKKQGIVNAVAVVTGSNTNSLAFHQKLGYKIIGRLPQAGYKFGHWEDTVWLYKQLAKPSTLV